MSNVKILGNASGTGTITLQAPNTNTDRTVNLPDEDVTLGGGGGGITMADHWRITADRNFVAADTLEFITANWERSDSTAYGQLGTGMTESSGVFSFPETGIYVIMAEADATDTDGTWNRITFSLHVTTNNSTFVSVSEKRGGTLGTRSIPYSITAIIDVTDTSNVKFKLGVEQKQYDTGDVRGDTNVTLTGFTVIRLGDT